MTPWCDAKGHSSEKNLYLPDFRGEPRREFGGPTPMPIRKLISQLVETTGGEAALNTSVVPNVPKAAEKTEAANAG